MYVAGSVVTVGGTTEGTEDVVKLIVLTSTVPDVVVA
jgi:hypothetical protein